MRTCHDRIEPETRKPAPWQGRAFSGAITTDKPSGSGLDTLILDDLEFYPQAGFSQRSC